MVTTCLPACIAALLSSTLARDKKCGSSLCSFPSWKNCFLNRLLSLLNRREPLPNFEHHLLPRCYQDRTSHPPSGPMSGASCFVGSCGVSLSEIGLAQNS